MSNDSKRLAGRATRTLSKQPRSAEFAECFANGLRVSARSASLRALCAPRLSANAASLKDDRSTAVHFRSQVQ